MEENKIELNDGLTLDIVLEKTKQFLQGELTPTDFDEWGKTLNVRTSIPILDKMQIIMLIISKRELSQSDLEEVNVVELYKWFFFYGYLSGYLMINIPDELMTYDNYDILEPIWGNFIESFANRDINILKSMLHDTIDFYGINGYTEAVKNIDINALEKVNAQQKQFVETLNAHDDLVEKLGELSAINNPYVTELVSSIKREAIKTVKEQNLNTSSIEDILKTSNN